tara:strand:- start:5 stop:439 length:435 start_codon:yes stop_codon:yes gene_type:complete
MCFSDPKTVLIGMKSCVIRKIMNYVKSNINLIDNHTSILSKSPNHKPNIPIHKLYKYEFERLIKHTPCSTTDLMKPIHMERYFHFEDIIYVPIWVEDTYVYCVRILQKQTDYTTDLNIGNMPIQIYINDIKYICSEESMLFSQD